MDGCVVGFYFEWRLDKANAISAHFTYIRSAPLKRGGEINDEDPDFRRRRDRQPVRSIA